MFFDTLRKPLVPYQNPLTLMKNVRVAARNLMLKPLTKSPDRISANLFPILRTKPFPNYGAQPLERTHKLTNEDGDGAGRHDSGFHAKICGYSKLSRRT